MKIIITIILSLFLSFSTYSQIDSVKSSFKFSTITNLFKKKAKSSLQNKLSGNNSVSSNSDSVQSDTSSVNLAKKLSIRDTLQRDSSVSKLDSIKVVENELLKNMRFPVDTSSSKAINIFIVGSSNVDLSVSSGGIVTVNKIPPGLNQQLLMLNGDGKKKGFLSDMDTGKLTSLITLILASLPLIISSFK